MPNAPNPKRIAERLQTPDPSAAEARYDADVAPILKQAATLCKARGWPMLAVVRFDEEQGGVGASHVHMDKAPMLAAGLQAITQYGMEKQDGLAVLEQDTPQRAAVIAKLESLGNDDAVTMLDEVIAAIRAV